MKYLSSHCFNGCIVFTDSRIVYSSLGIHCKNSQNSVLKSDYDGEPIDWSQLIKRIESDKEKIRQGQIINLCSGCSMVSYEDWDKKTEPGKFNKVIFASWGKCNSKCRYCKVRGRNFLIKNIKKASKTIKDDTYDIIPIIKDLLEKNLLTNNAVIDFAGGEPTLYCKFNEAIKLLVNDGRYKILVNTNAILYSEPLEKAVRNGIADVTVSIDAGTKHTHEKIKRVMSYDIVLQNLEKYCKVLSDDNINKVNSKYILVRNYNDNTSEIEKWIENSVRIGVSQLIINVDDYIFKYGIPDLKTLQRFKKCIDYFINTLNKINYSYEIYPNALNIYRLLGYTPPIPFYQAQKVL